MAPAAEPNTTARAAAAAHACAITEILTLDMVEWVARHVITDVAKRRASDTSSGVGGGGGVESAAQEGKGTKKQDKQAVLAGEMLLCPFYRCFLADM